MPLCCNKVGRREKNEDSIYPRLNMGDTDSRLFLVCDGMGGHENGEIASSGISQVFADYWLINAEEKDTEQKVSRALAEGVHQLETICLSDGAERKMGTTLALASINDDSIMVAHIGDSRIYLIRHGEGIVFKTKDHSLVQSWVDAGLITAEQARTNPKKNVITRAIQPSPTEAIEPEVSILTDIKDGDYLFICSDGITESIDDTQLELIFMQDTTSEEKMEEIIRECEEKSKDNFSAYLIPLIVDNIEIESSNDMETTLSEEDIAIRQREREMSRHTQKIIDTGIVQPVITSAKEAKKDVRQENTTCFDCMREKFVNFLENMLMYLKKK